MDILQELGKIMGGGQSGAADSVRQIFGKGFDRNAARNASGAAQTGSVGTGAGLGAGSGGKLGDLLDSGMMGRIAKTVLGDKQGGFSWLKGALLAGAGSMLWGKLTERVQAANANTARYAGTQQPVEMAAPGSRGQDAESLRVMRALIYAAKADGHIDDQEQATLDKQFAALNLGREQQAVLDNVMKETVDPHRIAEGVTNAQEALRLYTLSAAAINPDQYMEQSYLKGLAQALGIPDDVRDQVDRELQNARMTTPSKV